MKEVAASSAGWAVFSDFAGISEDNTSKEASTTSSSIFHNYYANISEKVITQ
jgi:hypothetical protein